MEAMCLIELEHCPVVYGETGYVRSPLWGSYGSRPRTRLLIWQQLQHSRENGYVYVVVVLGLGLIMFLFCIYIT